MSFDLGAADSFSTANFERVSIKADGGSANVSVFARIAPDAAAGDIFNFGGGPPARLAFSLAAADLLRVHGDSGTWDWTAPGVVLGSWQSVGFTYDVDSFASADPKIYREGLPLVVTKVGAYPGSHPIPLTSTASVGFDGRVAEIAVWRRVLTDFEMWAVHVFGPIAIPKGLSLYWPLSTDTTADIIRGGSGEFGGLSHDHTIDGTLAADPPQIALPAIVPFFFRAAVTAEEALALEAAATAGSAGPGDASDVELAGNATVAAAGGFASDAAVSLAAAAGLRLPNEVDVNVALAATAGLGVAPFGWAQRARAAAGAWSRR